MHGSSTVLPSKLQQELAGNRQEQNNVVRPEGLSVEQQLVNSTKSAQLTGAGDAAAISRTVASAGSIESAIDSVISQARAEGESVSDLPGTLPPELLQSVNAIKEAVCYHSADIIILKCRMFLTVSDIFVYVSTHVVSLVWPVIFLACLFDRPCIPNIVMCNRACIWNILNLISCKVPDGFLPNSQH